MKHFFLFSITLLIQGSLGITAIIPFGFIKASRDKLVFTSSAQSLYAGNCSALATVQLRGPSNAVKNATSNLTVNLSGGAGITYYSDSDCSTAISTVTILSGQSAASFYFLSSSVGSKSTIATVASVAPASQSQTIATNAFTWTGGGGNANWSTGANWAGGSAPGTSDTALFDGSCVSNCSPTVNGAYTIGKLRMATGYTGTILQSNSLTVALGYYQKAGTFNAASSALTVGGDYTFAGGTFTAGTSTLILGGNAYGPAEFKPGSATYYNVTFASYNGSFNLTTTLNLNGELVLGGNVAYSSSIFTGGGIIRAAGNVTANQSNPGPAGEVTLKIIGTSDQTLTGVSSSGLPQTEITSTGGTIYLMGTLAFNGNFTYNSGTVNAGTSTVNFGVSNYSLSTISASGVNFKNVSFGGYAAFFALVGALNVNGDLTTYAGFQYGYDAISGGPINVGGNYTVNNSGSSPGSAAMNFVGSGDSTLTYTAGVNMNGAITVNKTGGGKVLLATDFNFATNLTITGGTLNMSNHNLTVGGNVLNSGVLQRGSSPSCGTLTYGGSYSGTAAICP